MALVAGFGGMRCADGTLRFAPRLPERFSRLAFTVGFLDRCLRVELAADRATYTLSSGPPLTLHHHGIELTVSEDAPVTRTVAPLTPCPAPSQPPHRVPNAR
ncbi:glycosyl hydrolase family 65 protein [Streptomyces sp. NPDC008137]|uniref:glycosyl hydrolase family 65 protein n=1 Tax=Streptomyces sp. NPDC008137 TaxID=3364813 RepID=UPI0036E883D2